LSKIAIAVRLFVDAGEDLADLGVQAARLLDPDVGQR
jgi:hypothetical protein